MGVGEKVKDKHRKVIFDKKTCSSIIPHYSPNKSEEEVVVRRRPVNQDEIAAWHEGVIEMDINIRKPLSFIERGLYDERFRFLVDSVLEDLNGTISSYGQIGMGKTFTMEGVWSDPDLQDLIPDSFDYICTRISRSENQQYLVRPDVGVYVMDLISFVTKSVTEIEHVTNVGNQNRAVGIIQRGLYDERFRVVVDSVLEDFNVTISSYGQIGTGKTFTMEGVWSDPDLQDLIPDSFDYICTRISQSENQQYLVRPDVGVYVMDLISFVTKSVTEIEHVTNVGNQNRAVGYNEKNMKNKPKINEDPKDALLQEFQDEIVRPKSQLDKKGLSSCQRKLKKRQNRVTAGYFSHFESNGRS
ncbi:kinesin-like protein KIF3B [Glandiceps talaboti]